MRFFAVALLFGAAASYAQPPEVPQKMGFAGMTLTIREDARREIQKDVELLMQHARYYTMKVERARTYFPMIEKIFAEEGVPDDFKYLVLQESALVADAVSVSNAVGFWQFKDFTALEMGLRVDKEVDERMNLVSSTRGAAKYLKQSNYYFNNWLLALQSYQMGAGGVRRAIGNEQNGARNMEITPDTYWYVKKFLAHKVAFESVVQGEPQLRVIAYEPRTKKTLKEIADDVSAEESLLQEYNKWLKGSSIPDDKLYTVLVPVGKLDGDFTKLVLTSEKASKANPLPARGPVETRRAVNSIPIVVAGAGENIVGLAARGHINLSSFLKYNDVGVDHPVSPGEIYFLAKKKSKGEEETYKVKPGEDLWSVSQRFGVRIKSLSRYNRLNDQILVPGTVVWLRSAKPAGETTSPVQGEEVVLENESFDWDMQTPSEVSMVTPPATIVTIENSPKQALTSASEHLVKAGDTFYSIARLYSIEVTDLLSWNNRTIEMGLKPGEILKVVDSEPIKMRAEPIASVQTVLTTHEVKSSDTLYSIARQYGVTIKELMEWNHKKDFSLSRGEKLQIRQIGH